MAGCRVKEAWLWGCRQKEKQRHREREGEERDRETKTERFKRESWMLGSSHLSSQFYEAKSESFFNDSVSIDCLRSPRCPRQRRREGRETGRERKREAHAHRERQRERHRETERELNL